MLASGWYCRTHGGREEVPAQAEFLAAELPLAEGDCTGEPFHAACVVRIAEIAGLSVAVVVRVARDGAVGPSVEIVRYPRLHGWLGANSARAICCRYFEGALGRAHARIGDEGARAPEGLVLAPSREDRRRHHEHARPCEMLGRGSRLTSFGAGVVEHQRTPSVRSGVELGHLKY